MPLDPQVQALLDAAKKAGAPELWQLSPMEARNEYRRRVERVKLSVDIYRTENRSIDGPAGAIPLRIYTPRAVKPAEKLPVLVWYHGGGYVIGDPTR